MFSKIDRVMGNEAWGDIFPTAEVSFLPEGLFDHSPMLLTVYPDVYNGKKPFRYFKMWSSYPNFLEKVDEGWKLLVVGSPMYCLVKKLKAIKVVLKDINKMGFNDLHVADAKAQRVLQDCQVAYMRILVVLLWSKMR